MSLFVHIAWGGAIGFAIRDSGKFDSTTGDTTFDVPLGTYEVGDVIVFHVRWGGGDSLVAFPSPSGWTVAAGRYQGGFSYVMFRVMQSGDGTTVTITDTGGPSSGTNLLSTQRWNIAGAATGESAFVEASSSANANPALTPSWGTAENIWLTCMSTRKTQNSFTKHADYGSQLDGLGGASDSTSYRTCRSAGAHRVLSASSVTPGAWTVTGTIENPRYYTVAVRPAS